MTTRSTQTSEPGRCATLLLLLARLPQPLALLEVGASAGLCLLPDRYGYDYQVAGRHQRLIPSDASAETSISLSRLPRHTATQRDAEGSLARRSGSQPPRPRGPGGCGLAGDLVLARAKGAREAAAPGHCHRPPGSTQSDPGRLEPGPRGTGRPRRPRTKQIFNRRRRQFGSPTRWPRRSKSSADPGSRTTKPSSS